MYPVCPGAYSGICLRGAGLKIFLKKPETMFFTNTGARFNGSVNILES